MFKISLAAARVNANLTQTEVASALGINKSSVVRWEKGYSSPRAAIFKSMCDLYGCPTDAISLPKKSS